MEGMGGKKGRWGYVNFVHIENERVLVNLTGRDV
jgi:hypothetical protein